MLVYATVGDYLDVDDNPPDNIDALLATASRLVRKATKSAIYDVDAAGKPSDVDVLAAFRDATVLHAKAMADAGITSPNAGAAGISALVTSASIVGASVSYAGATGDTLTARAGLLSTLCADALWCLESVGMIWGVQTW